MTDFDAFAEDVMRQTMTPERLSLLIEAVKGCGFGDGLSDEQLGQVLTDFYHVKGGHVSEPNQREQESCDLIVQMCRAFDRYACLQPADDDPNMREETEKFATLFLTYHLACIDYPESSNKRRRCD